MKTLIDFDSVIWALASACDGKRYNYRGRQWEHHAIAVKALESEDKDISELYVTKEPEEWSTVETTVVKYVNEFMNNLEDPFDAVFLVSSDTRHFRYDLATIQPYKGNRSGLELPYHFKDIKEFIVNEYSAKKIYKVETDDAVGILYEDGDLIVSPDKDLNQLPGLHINSKSKYEVSEIEGLQNFYSQVVTGDKSDNIPGLYGIGHTSAYIKKIKKATNEIDMFNLVAKLYEQRFGSYWKMFMLENCRLLWLIRNPTSSTFTYWMEQLSEDWKDMQEFYFNPTWKGEIFCGQ